MAVRLTAKGDYARTKRFLEAHQKGLQISDLDRYGKMGVEALASATPVDSGETASSWGYRIVRSKGSVKLEWTNSNVNDGVPIAIILQYGHGTRNGGYVQGRDYINPAMRPIFDQIADAAWKGVMRL